LYNDDTVEVLGMSLRLARLRHEEIAASYARQIAKDFEAIINEMRDAKTLADRGLVGARAAKMDMCCANAGDFYETMVREPEFGFGFGAWSAF
jgi:hypothetical protein